jgi:hypothetical protein
VAILEVVVGGSLVVGTRLLEHLVEDTPAEGTSRLLAVSGGDKIICRGFALALLVLLLFLVIPLGAPFGDLRILILVFPLVLVTTKDGTNRFLADGVVGDDVPQLVGGGGGVAAQLSDQLLVGSARKKSHDHVGVSDVGKFGALFGETPDIVMEGLTRLLFTALEVPRVVGVYVGHLDVPFEHPL